MTKVNQHHISKKRRYSVILIPDEDASKAKSFKFSLWQWILIFVLSVAISAMSVVLLLTYTPLSELFPLSNPSLENKYNKEFVSLNNKMIKLMEDLVELRKYNIKLRQALGENINAIDTVDVKSLSQKSVVTKRKLIENASPQLSKEIDLGQYNTTIKTVKYNDARLPLSFPAVLPTNGYITRGFEPEKNHFGIDIVGKLGTIINAAADGTVIYSGWTYDYGYILILSHPDGFLTFYKHNRILLKNAGAYVRRGEPIAELGDSGVTSSGPHLHFEIWKDGSPVDPSNYLINFYL